MYNEKGENGVAFEKCSFLPSFHWGSAAVECLGGIIQCHSVGGDAIIHRVHIQMIQGVRVKGQGYHNRTERHQPPARYSGTGQESLRGLQFSRVQGF